ncbi:GILT-like protein 1 [Hetaerina americana]|uniref:GILT-like protein 1 n=1 Tax=Hetaerina americana TaxID=62018 RepID=UPI003A7F2F03
MFGYGMSATPRAAFLLVFVLGSMPAGQQQEQVQQVTVNERVNVSLYYESLCPDSVRFVINQLQPTWQSMAPYMNIRFIPFGKSASGKYSDGTIVFFCQHGPKECSGNKMQSCALSLLSTQDSQVQFVTCVMSKSDPSLAGPQCAAQVGLNYQDVEQCYQSSQGTNLQLAAEQETNKIRRPLRFVPTVVYNDHLDQRKQDDSLDDFKGALCKHIAQPPPECSE